MIIGLGLGVISLILLVISSILSLFSFAIPDQVGDAIAYFLGYIQYANFAIPVLTLISAVQYFLLFLAIWYTMKIAFWVLRSLPFFKNFGQPRLFESESESTIHRPTEHTTWVKSKSVKRRR